MKGKMKRILSIAIAMALALALVMPVYAENTAKAKPNTGTITVYRSSKSSYDLISVRLATGAKNFKIKRSDVKVTAGSAGAKLYSFEKYSGAYSYQELKSRGKWKGSIDKDYYYEAELKVSKAGTAAVSYKIGSKSYKIKVKVLAYKNPVKSIVMTGVNGGKNFASLTNASSYYSKKAVINKKQKNMKITVKPVRGWKVNGLSVYDSTAEAGHRLYHNGLVTARLVWGTLLPKHEYYVTASLVNTSNGAEISCVYGIAK